MAKEKIAKKELPIKKSVPEELKKGVYANYFSMVATEYEVIFDFARIIPPEEEIKPEEVGATVVARIAVPHLLVPRILKVLEKSITALERRSK